ncbi:MAG: hypothetical protein RJA50_627, partial [Actinomycetota bacterium]
VAFDFGIKTTILNCLGEFATVQVVPATTSAAEVTAMAPDGIFLSNGPGDPEMVHGAPETIRELLGTGVPLFGICLGHQLLALALGGKTFKLPFGHHGANHPVRNLATKTVEITSQNHNFCVDADSLATKAEVTHINLNDQTNEGMRQTKACVSWVRMPSVFNITLRLAQAPMTVGICSLSSLLEWKPSSAKTQRH